MVKGEDRRYVFDMLGVARLLLALALVSGCSRDDADRLEGDDARMDRTSVHVHVALRAALDGPDRERWARRLAAAAENEAVADALAIELYAQRELGAERLREGFRPRRALSAALAPDAALDPATDQAAYFVALVDETVAAEQRVSKQILVYEATRLRPQEVDAPLVRRLASALSRLVYARSGRCGGEASSPPEPPTEAEVSRALARWAQSSDVELEIEPARLQRDFVHVERLLHGGARACCDIRVGRDREAARDIEAWLPDAEALSVHPSRVALLRGWIALVDDDLEGARAQLEAMREAGPLAEDAHLYALLRDAVASGDGPALEDAHSRMVDRNWLSRLALVASHDAFVEDGLIAALRASPETAALGTLARGEAEVLRAARRRHPLFDQAHQGDQGPLDRLSSLFE